MQFGLWLRWGALTEAFHCGTSVNITLIKVGQGGSGGWEAANGQGPNKRHISLPMFTEPPECGSLMVEPSERAVERSIGAKACHLRSFLLPDARVFGRSPEDSPSLTPSGCAHNQFAYP